MATPAKKLGIAFGGGGSRAFVHLGILSVLEEAGIEVRAVSGSSMGAVLGAMYAAGGGAAAVRQNSMEYFCGSKLFGMNPKPARNDGLHIRPGLWGWFKKFARTLSIATVIGARRGLIKRNIVHEAIDSLVPDNAFADLALPFACVALDLTNGELKTFAQGSVRQATKAGTAVGVVYPPFLWNDREYADAAPVASVPVNACRALGVDVVLAVDIRTPKPVPFFVQNGFDVISRVEMIQSSQLNDAECDSADMIIKPDVGDVFWGDFTKLPDVVKRGEDAMRARLDDVQELLQA